MNIDPAITIDMALNTGLALLGYFYIMFCSGRWLSLLFMKKWNKRRKQEQRQKAMDAFSKPSELDGMEPGDPARAISRGGVVILVYRSEEKNDDHKTTSRKNHISP